MASITVRRLTVGRSRAETGIVQDAAREESRVGSNMHGLQRIRMMAACKSGAPLAAGRAIFQRSVYVQEVERIQIMKRLGRSIVSGKRKHLPKKVRRKAKRARARMQKEVERG